jgi:hypothetical protein
MRNKKVMLLGVGLGDLERTGEYSELYAQHLASFLLYTHDPDSPISPPRKEYHLHFSEGKAQSS